jgi:COP9 signalosome complex subunit 4
MYKNQVLGKEELTKFEASLQPHQRATMGDGLTIMERGIVEHNMIAVSKIYESIYISELARAVGVTAAKAEKIAATMIMDGSLSGTIDQVEGLVVFDRETSPNATWDKNISAFCVELNRITDVIQSLS